MLWIGEEMTETPLGGNPLWPQYISVTIPVVGKGDASPSGPDEIVVPSGLVGAEYKALPAAHFLDHDGMRHLLAFGSAGLEGFICLDTRESTVVSVPSRTQSDVNPVNADLVLFRDSVAAVLKQFPFHAIDDDEEMEAVTSRIGAMLLDVDPTGQELNGFWETFIDDLGMGNYATDLVTGEPG
jgi:hypothetical protein